MILYPAIDIKDGLVVRLAQGDFKKRIVYSKDPLKSARHWVKQGAQYLHIVDLDGASKGKPVNLAIVKEIAHNIGVPVELGGGIRDIKTIKELLLAGITRVVLGTKAAQDREFLEKAYKKFQEKIIVSIDALDGIVRTHGWDSKAGKLDAFEFGKTLKSIGFKEVIYTDIAKDGMLKGPNLAGIKKMLSETGLKVIASGGISCIDDIIKLKVLEKKGLIGIIIGKALYEGALTLPQALKI